MGVRKDMVFTDAYTLDVKGKRTINWFVYFGRIRRERHYYCCKRRLASIVILINLFVFFFNIFITVTILGCQNS